MVVLAGCSGSARPSLGSGPTFPGTPAGAQARWFFQALRRLPIPAAAIRAHFAPAFLAQAAPDAINARLAGAGQLRLVSVTSPRPDYVAFVMSVRGAQRFRVAFTVWFTALIRARWTGHGLPRSRAGRASYATYVLHPVLLTAIMVLFASVALAPELKFLVVALVAVPGCFVGGYAATRVPGISKIL